MTRHYTRAPHRRGTPAEDFAPNAALLIDFDNVTMAIRSNLAQELESLLNSEMIRGKVAVQRAYADWRRYPQYIVPLSESSIDLIFAPAYGSSKKNATDIRLAIDALELVFTRPEIGTFILLSGDSDFSSLVLKLKEYGKYVIGVGLQESSSDILVQNCDEYYSYTSLSGLREASEVQPERTDPWQLVERAIRRMTERNDVMRSDRLKQVMLELDSGFDEKAVGYSKFNRFLAEAASRDRVRLRKAANGQYEVSPADGSGSDRRGTSDRPRVSRSRQDSSGDRSSEPRAEKESGGGRERGRGRQRAEERSDADSGSGVSASALRGAYDLLSVSVRALSNAGEAVRDSEVKRKMLAKDGGFDETSLGFRKFSRFLQQAHDEGVIDLRQGDDGNYYIRPLGDEGTAAGGSRTAPASGDGERAGRGGGDGRGGGGGRGRSRDPETPRGEEREASRATPSPEPSSSDVGAGGGRESAGTTRSRRGLGRFRRGSRAPSPGGGTPRGIGPVDAPGGQADASADATDASADATDRADATGGTDAGESSTAPTTGASESQGSRPEISGSSGAGRGGLGRFRRGSRSAGGGRKRDPKPAEGVGDRSGSTDVTPSDSREAVEHMVRNYPGVGERTASRLLEEFGEGVFEVIDRDPDRVVELLSERRAHAVIEARRAEREAGGTNGSD